MSMNVKDLMELDIKSGSIGIGKKGKKKIGS